jgi:hypothetical protein
VRRFISSGTDFHCIVVLVETLQKQFSNTIRVNYKASHSEVITLEVLDKYPRCYKCFSQAHKVSKCIEPVTTNLVIGPPDIQQKLGGRNSALPDPNLITGTAWINTEGRRAQSKIAQGVSDVRRKDREDRRVWTRLSSAFRD